MRKLVVLCAVLLCFAGLAAAQDQPGNSLPAPLATFASPAVAAPASPAPPPGFVGEFSRWQLATCYEYFRFRNAAGSAGLQGFNASVTYFVTDSFGIEGDVAAAFGNLTPAFREKFAFYGGGPHVVLARGRVLQPWVHVLFGGAHITTTQGIGPSSLNNLGFVAGGGVDILLNSRFSIRGQGDFVGTRLGGAWQKSFQIKAGIVINF